MKNLSEPLAAHLASGATTLCHCWRLTRGDGAVMGFTDHDRAVEFDGVAYEAVSGLAASEAVSSLGLGVDNLDVAGALDSERIAEADILAGRYDDARVEVFVVNWAAPEQRILMFTGRVGELTRRGAAFLAELRGLAQQLGQVRGRIYPHLCDAELGDGRCGVDLDVPAFAGEGVVTAVADDRTVEASGLADFAEGWFRGGRLAWTSGANAGLSVAVKSHGIEGETARLELRDSSR